MNYPARETFIFPPTNEHGKQTDSTWRAALAAIQHNIMVQTKVTEAEPRLTYSIFAPLDGGTIAPLPLVLVHGASQQRGIFTTWARYLAGRGITCYTIDLRGHGASNGPPGKFFKQVRFGDYVADLQAFVQSESLLRDGFALLGHSLGGVIAQLYARDNPVAGLIVLAASSPQRLLATMGVWALAHPLRYLQARRSRTRAVLGTSQGDHDFLHETGATDNAARMSFTPLGTATQTFIRESLHLLCVGNVPLQAAQIMFMGGSEDRLVSPAVPRSSADDYGALTMIIGGASHNLMLRHVSTHEEAADHLAHFVYGLASSPATTSFA